MTQLSENQNLGSKRQVGRPRLLTTEQVLDAAIELGLEGLKMTTLASSLGVSIGMLYGYVSNRDELIKLAAARVIQDYDYPADVGQHWAVYAVQNAVAWFKFFTGPGEFLVGYIGGQAGPAAEIDRMTQWLLAMRKRGFEPGAAHLLQQQLGEITMGGAVSALHRRALGEKGDQLSSALVARGILDREDAELAVLTTQEQVWHLSLLSHLRCVAQDRGETLDEVALDRFLRDN